MERGHRMETEACRRVAEILSRVGDRWSVVVLMRLDRGAERFNDLRRAVLGISNKVLAHTLRGLERDGLVVRTVRPTKPPSVVYTLSDFGKDAVEAAKPLGETIDRHARDVEAARRRFDGKHPS